MQFVRKFIIDITVIHENKNHRPPILRGPGRSMVFCCYFLRNTETMTSIMPGTRNSAARTSAIVENGADPILQFEKKYE